MRSSLLASGVAAVAAIGVLVPGAAARTVGATAVGVTSVKPVLRYPQRGAALVPGKLNVIPASKSPTFNVTVRNAGTSAKTNVRVTLLIDPRHAKVKATDTLDYIGSNRTMTVLFGDLGKVPYAVRTTLTVAVSGGKTIVYPVIFRKP